MNSTLLQIVKKWIKHIQTESEMMMKIRNKIGQNMLLDKLRPAGQNHVNSNSRFSIISIYV